MSISVMICLWPFNFTGWQLLGLSILISWFMEYFTSTMLSLEHIHRLLKKNLELDENGEETEEIAEDEKCCGGIGENSHCKKSE